MKILKWDQKAKEAKQKYELCQREGNSIPEELWYKTHLRTMHHLECLRGGGQGK